MSELTQNRESVSNKLEQSQTSISYDENNRFDKPKSVSKKSVRRRNFSSILIALGIAGLASVYITLKTGRHYEIDDGDGYYEVTQDAYNITKLDKRVSYSYIIIGCTAISAFALALGILKKIDKQEIKDP